ncbi:rho GTPase-activating protein 11A-like isoform X1 [Bufo gargarizans]|uniref:rho GTPase-activating protein 11A-like isoform X1 n=1 Tax=Bufo gargarizans TaxID=30331 RepID=UPI001CF33D05|nr:rho GTPase-activating protein 11A-like isoform X1 [Bufo gargarizans]
MMKMAPDYLSLARLAVIQQLRSYGIKIKHWNSKSRSDPGRGGWPAGKIFGAPLHTLPQLNIPAYGNIPAFLVGACKYLEDHVQTEGLFRKSGSVARQKLLKTKLENGEDGLSEAPPCDVASILKQFFRELPDPILPADLQDALIKAQNLGSDEERTSATVLISCLMSDLTLSILRYFCSFLHSVSMRCDSNRMDSNNLAVIFAPNLLHSGDGEKISPSTEKKLRIQAAIVKTLIDHPADIGCVPDFLLEKIPGMLGVDVGADTPGHEASEEDVESPGERKRRRRRSVGDFVSGALNKLKTNRTPSSTPQTDRTVLSSMVTPLILTPSAKRKLPLDSAQGISTKKRKSVKQNLSSELLPSSLFGGGSTPACDLADVSPCVYFEGSESSFTPSTSNLRRSKRRENRKVQRVESGKTGCFSPKISRTEMVRRSLRLRFSLGKSSKDVSTGFPASIRSQNIGWRLANSIEFNVSGSKTDVVSSPVDSPFVSTGSKKISKSEENLLTPKKSDHSSHRLCWTGPHPVSEFCDKETPKGGYLYAENCYSEPVVVTGKPPVMPKPLILVACSEEHQNSSLCEEGESQVHSTLQRITKAFTESGSDLHMVVECSKSANVEDSPPPVSAPLPNAVVQDCNLDGKHSADNDERTSEEELHMEEKESSPQGTGLVDLAEAKASEVVLKIVEETDCINDNVFAHHKEESGINENGDLGKPVCPVTSDAAHGTLLASEPRQQKVVSIPARIQAAHDPLPRPQRRTSRVSDHIQHFNKLCLNDHSVGQKLKSPIKFERTPVRRSVRRINSMSGVKRQVDNGWKENAAGSPMVKAVSFDGSLSSEVFLTNSSSLESSVDRSSIYSFRGHFRIPKQSVKNTPHSLNHPANPPKTVLEDLTNQGISRTSGKKSDLSATTSNPNAVRILSGREHSRYRGSPKNPIARVTFLPATKPLDL